MLKRKIKKKKPRDSMKFIVLPPFKRISQCIEYLIEERLFYLTSAKATDKIKARCKEGVCDALLRE